MHTKCLSVLICHYGSQFIKVNVKGINFFIPIKTKQDTMGTLNSMI